MSDEREGVILAAGDLAHVRGLARLLAAEGIRAELVRPPEGRGSG